MQSIGELDEDDADVLDHRQHHLAKTLGLRFGSGAELDLVEFADAVDEQRDLGTEFLLDFGNRRLGVLDRVMQDRRHDRFRIEMHVGQRLRNGNRVRDVGLAGLAGLSFVRVGAVFVGANDVLDLFLGEVGLERIKQVPQAMVAFRRARQF